jgi:uncharacterized integral membrane protein
MAMERLKQNAERLQEDVHALIEAQAEYYRLWTFKVSMKSIALLLQLFLLILCAALALLFVSVAAALYLSEWLQSDALGFLIVGSAYVAAGMLAYFLRAGIERPLLKKFSAIFFND